LGIASSHDLRVSPPTFGSCEPVIHGFNEGDIDINKLNVCARCHAAPACSHGYCSPCKADYDRMRNYGISTEEYSALLVRQDGACSICLDRLVKPHVDHNHRTGEVRGLLCNECNLGIGKLGDDEVKVARAVLYLLGGV
jgi:hypothetical protein